jgi:hypothetical protein
MLQNLVSFGESQRPCAPYTIDMPANARRNADAFHADAPLTNRFMEIPAF